MNDCPMPDFCVSSKGPMGKNGVECNTFCPMKCGPEEMVCSGGKDWNDCPLPDTCMHAKGPMGSKIIKVSITLRF